MTLIKKDAPCSTKTSIFLQGSINQKQLFTLSRLLLFCLHLFLLSLYNVNDDEGASFSLMKET